MTSSNQLDQAVLLKRSKELDAQQEYLDTQREMLEETYAPEKTKVLEAQLAAKAYQLNGLLDQIREASKLLKTRQKELQDQSTLLEVQIDKKQQDLDLSLDALASANGEVKRAKQELTQIEVDTASRHKYFQDQESQIEKYIDEGNETLTELQSKVSFLVNEQATLESRIVELRQQEDEGLLKLSVVEIEYADKVADLELILKGVEADIKKARQDVLAEKQKYKGIADEVNSKLVTLKEKEESIIAKRDALRLEEDELRLEKRRWNSTKALYSE